MLGSLYFIQEGMDGAIKIGWTANDPIRRRDNLQIGNSSQLRLIAVIEAVPQRLEFEWHRRFRGLQKRSEWFFPGIALIDAILLEAKKHEHARPVFAERVDFEKTPNLKVLADWMVTNKVNQSALAKKAGFSKAYISEVLSGKRPVPLKVARCFESATDGAVKAVDLLGLVGAA
jgi:hypothetical protein